MKLRREHTNTRVNAEPHPEDFPAEIHIGQPYRFHPQTTRPPFIGMVIEDNSLANDELAVLNLEDGQYFYKSSTGISMVRSLQEIYDKIEELNKVSIENN